MSRRPPPPARRPPQSRLRGAGAAGGLLAVVLLGAGGPSPVLAGPPLDSATVTGPARVLPRAAGPAWEQTSRGGGESGRPMPARVGRPAASTRIRFQPTGLGLADGSTAPVQPASTVEGELVVPENVRHLGWWDGGADAGDPFGSTVIAGHVDSATQGLGFFARLMKVRRGEVITITGDGHRARYRVVTVRTVPKQALSSGTRAFQQDGPHRLVLITCGGAYRPERGGYDSNLVVIAEPVGRVR